MRIHFAILPAQHARCARGRGGEAAKEREREGARAPVAARGANVFTPKRFWVHGDTLVWRPLTVNTYICMCSNVRQIAAPPSLSPCLSAASPLPCTCVKSSTLRCFGKMQTTTTTRTRTRTTMRGSRAGGQAGRIGQRGNS